MRTDAQRIARYNARMSATLLDPVRLAVITTQKARFAAYATEWVPLQQDLNTLLSNIGIPIIRFAAYTAFAGEIYHLTKHFQGQTLADACNVLVDKWSDVAHLGEAGTDTSLVLPTLQAILSNVFHMMVAPVTP